MGNVHYMISEAAKQVGVEPHALRYWEDELSLSIGRTEMGHRYYTKDDLQLFLCIKELKEEGLPLKDLKSLIPDLLRTKNELRSRKEANPPSELEETLRKLFAENNKILLQSMDFLLQAQDRQEEVRFQQLDALIRQQQQSRKLFATESSFRGIKKLLHI